MIRIQEAIVVEGRYDKNTLSQIVDATIIETSGFQILNDKAQLTLMRQIAKKNGLIIFTDSDGAGFVIRNFLKGAIEPRYLKHAYIPDIPGKERRKDKPGKEGKLGVEGMTPEIILKSLRRAGATFSDGDGLTGNTITKQDLFELGLSGGKDSRAKRELLLKQLEFPQHMSANAMLQALSLLYTREELFEFINKLPLMTDLEK